MQNNMTITNVPAVRIIAGNNDRKKFKESALVELAESIAQDGIAQPPTVRRVIVTADGNIHAVLDKSAEDAWNRLASNRPISAERTINESSLVDAQALYEIIAGERRTRAMRDLLQWEQIPVNLKDCDDRTASAIMLAENTNRVDLNPIEEAEAYTKRVEEGWSVEEIAQAAGRSTGIVSSRLKLLDLVPEAQHMVSTRAFPIGHAEAMVDLDSNRQRMALDIYNRSSHMPFNKWRDIVHQYRAAQIAESQTSMFNLDELHAHLLEEAEQDVPRARKGKTAITGAPSRTDLPPVRWSMKDSLGDILDRYVHDLQEAGRDVEASTIGMLYNTLVALNWTNISKAPQLDIKTGEPAGDLSHEVKIKE